MSKTNKLLAEDTVIIWGKVPVGECRKFFQQATGKEEIVTVCKDFQTWLFTQTGKTLKEALEELNNPSGSKSMEELMSERRFNIVKEQDKAFIIAFDKAINELGYDFGGFIGSGSAWSPLMIVYGKTGTKSRPCAARIYIKDDGIVLRLFLNKVDTHRQYIETAPAYIKEAFVFTGGDCKSCNTACAPGKKYTIDGNVMQKCNHNTFYFNVPKIEKLPDYMDLLSKFYPVKKAK
jgi:hypothetical protein